jgi:hypothetical protein
MQTASFRFVERRCAVVPRPRRAQRQPISRFWMLGGSTVGLAAFIIWGYPRFAASVIRSTPTPEPATATLAPSTPTRRPTATATQAPPEGVTPRTPPSPGIGGANKIALTAKNDIFLMDMDGSHIQQLTNSDVPKFDLQWLPGGRNSCAAKGTVPTE